MNSNQKYEEYWKLTLHNTGFYGSDFIDGLKILSSDIKFKNYNEQQEYFKKQIYIRHNKELNSASIRKWMNQYTKLGMAYRDSDTNCVILLPISYKIIKTTNISLRKIYISEAFYSASFNNDRLQNIKFLISVMLRNNNVLSEKELIALMIYRFNFNLTLEENADLFLSNYNKNYNNVNFENEINDFVNRKYNQISYVKLIIKFLDSFEIFEKDNIKYYKLNIDTEIGLIYKEIDGKTKDADKYLRFLFKKSLIQEGNFCWLTNICFPILIASHIKPFSKCDNNFEKIDNNNGILLNPLHDQLFDKGYISFDDSGTMIFSNKLSGDVKNELWISSRKLDNVFLSPDRKKYLQYHREKIFLC